MVSKQTAFGRLFWDRKPEGVPLPLTHRAFVRLYPEVAKYLPEEGPQVLERHPERWVCYFQLDPGGLMPKFAGEAEVWMLPDDGIERGMRLSALGPVPTDLEKLLIPIAIRDGIKSLVARKNDEGVDVTSVCSWVESGRLVLSLSYGPLSTIDPMEVMCELADALSSG